MKTQYDSGTRSNLTTDSREIKSTADVSSALKSERFDTNSSDGGDEDCFENKVPMSRQDVIKVLKFLIELSE